MSRTTNGPVNATGPAPEEMTPEKRARQEATARLTRFLIERLFGWTHAEFSNEGYGRPRISPATGKQHWVKGWYGVPPGKTEMELFPYSVLTTVTDSRKVAEEMEKHGYSLLTIKHAGQPWRAVFVEPGKNLLSQVDRILPADHSEAWAVGLAAEAAIVLKGDAWE